MRLRKVGIKDCLAGGFLASAVVLLVFSLFVSVMPGDTGRAAARVSRTVGERMHLLDEYISSALTADRRSWAGEENLPEDMVIYRYVDDTLQSWSNQFPVRNDDISSRYVFPRLSRPREGIYSPLAEVTEEPTFINFGQKWYLAESRSLGSRTVIAGLEIVDSMSGDDPGGVNKRLGLGRRFSVVPISEKIGRAHV